jgi:hypothetical protein
VAGTALFYAGAVVAAAGLLCVIRPIGWIGIRTRRRAGAVALAGAVLVGVAIMLPVATRAAAARDTAIDRWLPEWQFDEYHERRVRATPQQVFAAIRQVRSSDIFLFRTLIFIRNPVRRGQDANILNPPDEAPILDVALAGGFALLEEEPDRELLLGAIVIAPPGAVRRADGSTGPRLDPERFRALGRPGFARAAMNFRAIPDGNGWTRVTTETRIHAVDRETQRRFARYWRVIYPGSWIIRWNWLRAIEARIAS